MSLVFASLLWQRCYRGLLPLTGRSLDAAGALRLAYPDAVEARTYRVECVDPDGTVSPARRLSVERLRGLDGTVDGDLLLGFTNDAVYLFRGGEKRRVATGRRMALADCAVAAAAGTFALGYEDAHLGSPGVALGSEDGHLAWSESVEAPVNRVALTAEGDFLCAGLEDGRVLAVAAVGRTCWECCQDEPVTALALAGSLPAPVVGTGNGTLLSLDPEGGICWRSSVGRPVLAVAAGGEFSAAALSDGTTHALVCLGPEGEPLWEYELELAPTGLCLSEDGCLLALSGAGGTVSLFRIDLPSAGRGTLKSLRDRDLAASAQAADGGDFEGAWRRLRDLLNREPTDTALASELQRLERDWLRRLRRTAGELAGSGAYVEAQEALARASALLWWDRELFEERLRLRDEALENLRARARELEGAGEPVAAEACWRDYLELDPHACDARAALLELQCQRARALADRARAAAEAGRLDVAVTLWRQALELEDRDEWEESLRQAEMERSFRSGLELYEAHRLPEAAFQFRRVLVLQPDHTEAARYLGYCTASGDDSELRERFSRLEE